MAHSQLTAQNKVQVFGPGQWSNMEAAVIRELLGCLHEHEAELAEGRTDEGDPWCVIMVQNQDDPILHFARSSTGYMLAACDTLDVLATGSLVQVKARGTARLSALSRAMLRNAARRIAI